MEWDTIAAERRKLYFQEIRAYKFFSQVFFTRVKKSVFEEGDTYKEVLQSVKTIIAEESDHTLKNDLLTKLNFIISSSKSEKKRLEKLREFSSELMDTLSNETESEL